jgi:hypothetical protein
VWEDCSKFRQFGKNILLNLFKQELIYEFVYQYVISQNSLLYLGEHVLLVWLIFELFSEQIGLFPNCLW